MIRRILWVSNAPWVGSGYGQQTATFTKMLRDAGFDVHILANYGLSGSTSEWASIPVYPGFWNVWGNDAIESYCEMLRPDLVITLCDVWVLDENFGFKKGVTWVPWIPLDAEPLSEANKKPLRSAVHILPFTDFGERVLREAGFTNTTQVPHGIDTDVFKPLAGASKAPDGRLMSKEDFKRTDGFVMGMVGTNMGDRKNIHIVMEAFSRFVKDVPDARLRLHTDYTCPHGLNLIMLMNRLGIADKIEVTPTDEYHLGYTPSQMAAFYNGMDLLLSPSKGEGFGIPICFLPGASVTTASGNTHIEDIVVGDLVQTHKGRYRPVVKTMKRRVCNERILSIRTTVGNQVIRCTSEHPFLAYRREGQRFSKVREHLLNGAHADWIPASGLQLGDFLFVPKQTFKDDTRDALDLAQYVATDGEFISNRYGNHGSNGVTARDVARAADVSVYTARRVLGEYELERVGADTRNFVRGVARAVGWKPLTPLSRYLPLNEDTGYLLGQYVAEGSLGKQGQVEFASHAQELDIRGRLREIIEEYWGLPVGEIVKGNKGRLYFTSRHIATVLESLVGKGARNKHLPLNILWSNEDFARGVLVGAWHGDGCLNCEGTYSYSTCSEQLARDMHILLNAFGILACINRDKRRSWSVNVTGRQRFKMENMLNWYYGRTERNGQRFIATDDGYYVPIVSIDVQYYSGPVYNMEVQEDNSYCVEMVAVHNCEAAACGVPSIVTNWSAMPDVWCGGAMVQPATFQYADPNSFSKWAVVDPADLLEQIQVMYEAWQKPTKWKRLCKKVRKNALRFDAKAVFKDYWVPALQKIEEIIEEGGDIERWLN